MPGEAAVVTPPAAPPAPGVETVKPGVAAHEPKGAAAPAAAGAKPPAGAPITSATKEANPDDPTKPFKVVVEGKEYHLSQEEVTRLASKGIGADKKFGEAARIRQQVENFLTTLKEKPMDILMNPKIGLDFKKLAQDFLLKEIEREAMTPEQRELADARKKLQDAEDEKTQNKKQEESATLERLTKEAQVNYEKDIIATLEAEKLPKTRWIVGRIAYYLSEGLKRGVDLGAKDVVPFVRKDVNANIIEMFNVIDGETLAEMLGDGNVKKLNQTLLNKMKNPGGAKPAGGAAPAKPASAPAAKPGSDKMSKTEWRKFMDENY